MARNRARAFPKRKAPPKRALSLHCRSIQERVARLVTAIVLPLASSFLAIHSDCVLQFLHAAEP